METVVLIDDDDSIRNVFKRFLEKHGYTVCAAADGEAGLALVDQVSPDLVITDIMMPAKDGLEVVLELKRNRPGMPVIAISGGMRLASMDFLPVVKKFGANKVLYKPVDLDELLAAVREQLPNG